MNNQMSSPVIILDQLLKRMPKLEGLKEEIQASYEIMKNSFANGGKLLICGNGGSAADAEHIVGELMKGFLLKRTLSGDEKKKFEAVYPEDGGLLADRLQGSLPAISLVNASALLTAWGNDMDFDMVYAQQVYGFGKPGDTLLGISTSGNANNVLHAVKVAKILDIHTIGMTGEHGGMLAKICDAAIRVPASDTPGVQEYHLPVYHTLCAMLEAYFFSS